MELIPAVMLKNGMMAHLEGDANNLTMRNTDPVEQAHRYVEQGFEWINVHDLDARHGDNQANAELITQILREVPIHIQYGGGLRSVREVNEWIDRGMHRVIVGSMALNNPQAISECCQKFPGQMILGIRFEDGYVTDGSNDQPTGQRVIDLAIRHDDAGLAAMILLDINRDGSLRGINTDLTADIAFSLKTPVIAAGGIGSLHDLQEVKEIEHCGVIGVICGRALHNGIIPITEALTLLRGSTPPATLTA
jgi:phosphoribosylformimino-5-aminoimidazole carboxamide ribotide isomerase